MHTKSSGINFYNLKLDEYEIRMLRDRAIDFMKSGPMVAEKAYFLAAIAILNHKDFLKLDEDNFRSDGSDRRVG